MPDKLNLFTHNGLFHADDVFAAAMLSLLSDDVNIVRGGDDDVPEDKENWIIFDIGGGELDHHTEECKQRNETHPGTDVPYAACGLVWRKYYRDILETQNCPERYYDSVYTKMEKSLVLGIDANDNGFDYIMNTMESMPNILDKQKSAIQHISQTEFTISQMIKDFNPSWESDRDPYEAFMDAMSFAQDVFLNRLDSIMDALDGRDYILQHIDYSAGHLMILEHFAPWQGVVTSQSNSNPKAEDLWYVISPALRGGWNIQCVLDDPSDRTSYRHPLPKEWYGLRKEELQKCSGVEDAIFCHPSGFLAGCQTQQGAMKMANIAMNDKGDK